MTLLSSSLMSTTTGDGNLFGNVGVGGSSSTAVCAACVPVAMGDGATSDGAMPCCPPMAMGDGAMSSACFPGAMSSAPFPVAMGDGSIGDGALVEGWALLLPPLLLLGWAMAVLTIGE